MGELFVVGVTVRADKTFELSALPEVPRPELEQAASHLMRSEGAVLIVAFDQPMDLGALSAYMQAHDLAQHPQAVRAFVRSMGDA